MDFNLQLAMSYMQLLKKRFVTWMKKSLQLIIFNIYIIKLSIY